MVLVLLFKKNCFLSGADEKHKRMFSKQVWRVAAKLQAD
jgi:hypothetical protein